ncbi:MAG: A24 family peptidase [Erysipelotrichaceae bacterium]
MSTLLQSTYFISIAILLTISVISCWVAQYATKKEDIRYLLVKNESMFCYLLSSLFCFIVCYFNPEDTFVLLAIKSMVLSILTISFLIDFKLHELPDTLTLSIGCIGLFSLIFTQNKSLLNFKFLFVIIFILLVALFLCLKVQGALGFGDVKYLVAITPFLSFTNLLSFWMNSILSAALFAIGILIKGKKKDAQMAFGPFLILGLFTVFCNMLWVI